MASRQWAYGRQATWLALAAIALTAAVYWPGLSGSWLFDDYPNIVDNPGVQPHAACVPALVRAALSSPASEFKRPLASLSFAVNYLAGGLDPLTWKLTNLLIHLLNGVLVFVLARMLLTAVGAASAATTMGAKLAAEAAPTAAMEQRTGMLAALVAAGWMLLPINLTAVLYVVQREESMANLFVLLGLIGYVAGRRRMLYPLPISLPDQVRDGPCTQGEEQGVQGCTQGKDTGVSGCMQGEAPAAATPPSPARRGGSGWGGFWLCAASLVLGTAVGLLAKETAVMLPLYALLIEWIVFRFSRPFASSANLEKPPMPSFPRTRESSLNAPNDNLDSRFRGHDEHGRGCPQAHAGKRDWRILGLFLLVLALPGAIGLAWQLPIALNPASWATRDFTLGQRLLSEARIVCDYIVWTLLPTPHALSFYHDEFRISTGLLRPWTTLASLLALAALVALMLRWRTRRPLLALGIALFLGCQLLTGTILSLELVYEHRNYFASFGVMLAVVPWLVGTGGIAAEAAPTAAPTVDPAAVRARRQAWGARLRHALLAALLLWWAGLTALTAWQWGDPLRLAQTLAERAPESPRAQYELGRTYIMYSHYDPASPYTRLAYAPLEKAASFPESSILPQQALIFMNSRMGLPLKPQWWDSLIAKLKARKPGVQDESSLAALARCAQDGACPLPTDRMVQAFEAALDYPRPSARLQATYGDYAWNALDDHALGLRMIEGAVQAAPREPAYHITLARMLATQGRYAEVERQIEALQKLNIGGRLDRDIAGVRALLPAKPVR